MFRVLAGFHGLRVGAMTTSMNSSNVQKPLGNVTKASESWAMGFSLVHRSDHVETGQAAMGDLVIGGQ